jgi:streptogramin lyase
VPTTARASRAPGAPGARRARTRAVALAAVVAMGCGALACSSDDGADGAEPADGAAGTTEAAPAGESSATEPLADQTPPTGANGLAFDRYGTLWVADLAGVQILGIDAASGAILHRYGADVGVTGADDLAFDAEGRLWWSGLTAGVVGRISQPGTPAAANETVAELGPGVNPIAVGDDDRVFAAQLLQGDALYELDPDDGAEPRLVLDRPGNLNAFDVGDDGRIYAPRVGLEADGAVVAIDPDSGDVDVLAEGLNLNMAVELGPDGTIYVLTASPAGVSTVDARSGEVAPFVELPASAVVDNMTFGDDGNMYVTGFDQPTVWRVSPEGEVTATITIGQG